MAEKSGWTGWIGFAGVLMVIVGGIDFFEGMIALFRGQYYFVNPSQIIVVNTTTWGWLTLLWGIVLVMAGFGILAGASWARWFAIIVGSLNFFQQLGFAGNSNAPLWGLTIMALTIVVLYALIVHWDAAKSDMAM